MSASKQLPSGIEVRIRQDLSEGSRGATTLIIDPVITKAGYRVTMADIGDRGFGKIDGNNPKEEIISWTGMTDNGTTYTLTGIVWGVNFHNRTGNVSANMKRHISGAKFSINTDMHYIADQFDLYVKKEDFNVTDNSIGWGDGTKDHNKVLEARNGAENVPFISYDEILNKWIISNDGVNSFDPEQGGSGVTAGDAISIVTGAVNVKTKEASGIHITDDEVALELQTNPGLNIVDNKLGVKIKENTGLLKDADGIYCDSIDPDNPVAQSPAQLIGGTAQDFYRNMYNNGVETVSFENGYSNGTIARTKQSGYLQINATSQSGGVITDGAFVSSNTIDLTNIDKIVVDWNMLEQQSDNNDFYIVISSNKTANISTYDLRIKVDITSSTTRTKTELDVSSLSGSYYVRIHNYVGSASFTQYANIAIYNISLFRNPTDPSFTANIDGVEYKNVAVDLTGNTNIVVGANTTLQSLYNNSVGQSFTILKMGEVKRIGTYFRRTGVGTNYNLTISLYNADSNGSPIGDIIKTTTIPALDVPFDTILYMNVNQVLPAGKYHIAISPSSQSYEWYLSAWYSSNTYAGGEMFINGSKQVNNDLRFSIEFENQTSFSSLSELVSRLQTAIRLRTSKLETLFFNTDHFEIISTTSGRASGSSVLRLTAPTTGTDISGAGYLDLGANATEVACDGNSYKLVRLDEGGQIGGGYIPGLFGDGSDGDVFISSDTSLSRDMYYNTLIINNGTILNSNGYRIFVKEYTKFIGTGKIASNGGDGNNGGRGGNTSHSGDSTYVPSNERENGKAGGVAAYSTGTLPIPKAGGNGGNGGDSNSVGSNGSKVDSLLSIGVASSAGGSGGSSQGGGTGSKAGGTSAAGTITNAVNRPRTVVQALNLFDLNGTSISQLTASAGGGGGGGGGGWYNNVSYSYLGGGGGGAGGSGGVILFFSRNIYTSGNNIFLQAKGGKGGDGGPSGCGTVTGAGGGGAGGSGGCIIVFGNIVGNGLMDVSGGIGGVAGEGGTVAAQNGYNGVNGIVYLL